MGAKGTGKTLILKEKRRLLQQQSEQNVGKGAIFVPCDRPYLDLLTSVGSLSKSHLDHLMMPENAKPILRMAFFVSALCFHRAHSGDHVMPETLVGIERYLPLSPSWLTKGKTVLPSFVFTEILRNSVSDICQLRNSYHSRLEHEFLTISQGIYVDSAGCRAATVENGKPWV